ncbi:MAG: hypothetical protein ACOYBL_00790 [Lachnospiraceae bacterium]|jgi:hypothetical protein
MRKIKLGLGLLLAGCMSVALTACSPGDIVDKVLSLTDHTEEESEEETEVVEVDVAKPVLTADLSGSVTYAVGQEAEPLTVSATISDSGTLSYQWYRNTTNSNGGGKAIEGETSETFTPPTDEEGTVYYYAVATNTIGDSINGVTTGTIEVVVNADGIAEESVIEEAKMGWQQDARGWWYGKEDGSYAVGEWLEIDGKWYNFDENGYARFGWYQEGDDWYYFGADRSMITNMEIDGYKLGADGKRVAE